MFDRHPNIPALSRRSALQAGSLSLLGLSLTDLFALRSLAASQAAPPKQRAKSCVFIFLFGGPSHIDLWDMKPDAPAEVRGEFKPIATNVAGIQICEHLPLLADQMDKFCLLRSMSHRMPVHGPACSEMYTGREYFGPPVTDEARPEDWPSLAALATRYLPTTGGVPPAIVLPTWSHFVGQTNRIAGQTGGRMGEQFNPMLIEGDPSRQDFEVQGLALMNDAEKARLQNRHSLLTKVQAPLRDLTDSSIRTFEDHRQKAFELLERNAVTAAFNLQSESQENRSRYGFSKFGQSLLLARRLVETGVPLISVNWEDESRFDKTSPQWDTHHDNFPKLKNILCPIFDRAFSTFLADLHNRGLLEDTLITVVGEFGRTPKIGQLVQNNATAITGRDHWPHAFTALVAGGGVSGGQVYGSTTPNGGYVADKPVSPADLAATILQHLGIDLHHHYHDGFQRIDQRICEGIPIPDLA